MYGWKGIWRVKKGIEIGRSRVVLRPKSATPAFARDDDLETDGAFSSAETSKGCLLNTIYRI
jgi:hypothetical protein